MALLHILLLLLPVAAAARHEDRSAGFDAFAATGDALFAGRYDGIYRSTDGGNNWISTGFGLRNGRAGQQQGISPRYLSIMSLAAGGGAVFAGTFVGGFSSTDNGESWWKMELPMPANDSAVTALAATERTVVAGTYRGAIYYSSDRGVSWSGGAILPGGYAVRALIIAGSIMLAGTSGGGLYRSIDGGRSWSGIDPGIMKDHSPPLAIVTALAASGSSLFAAFPGDGVFRSTDDGESWQAINAGLPNNNVEALSVADRTPVAVSGGKVYLYDGSGRRWKDASAGLHSHDARTLGTGGGRLFVGTYSGVYRASRDQTLLEKIEPGLRATDITMLAASKDMLLAGSSLDIYRSHDGGRSWEDDDEGLAHTTITALGIAGEIALAGTENGLFRSAGRETPWEQITLNTRDGYTGAPNLVVGLTALGDTCYVSFSRWNRTYDWRSGNGGKDWQAIDVNDLRSTARIGDKVVIGAVGGIHRYRRDDQRLTRIGGYGITYGAVTSLAVIGSTIVAGTPGAGLYRSNDSGVQWHALDTEPASRTVLALAAAGGSFVASFDNRPGVYRSSDLGTTWNRSGLEDCYVFALATDGKALFAGTSRGIWRSDDDGGSWEQIKGRGHE